MQRISADAVLDDRTDAGPVVLDISSHNRDQADIADRQNIISGGSSKCDCQITIGKPGAIRIAGLNIAVKLDTGIGRQLACCDSTRKCAIKRRCLGDIRRNCEIEGVLAEIAIRVGERIGDGPCSGWGRGRCVLEADRRQLS